LTPLSYSPSEREGSMTRSICSYAILFASSLMFALLAPGQEGVAGAPPPEVRSHIDALVRTVNNGSSEEWAKMTQEHFSPGALKRQSAEARKQVFDNIRREFGIISLGLVEGPEPVQLHIKGSTGASGV